MGSPTIGLRCLVACDDCRRQFDVAGFATGSKFHCSCGRVLEVPRFDSHDAAVARCSSCGAARDREALSCRHCGSDYTLHEQDLHTICPTCMTRISDRARFCHHCATPILAQGTPGKPTTSRCPACGKGRRLTSRSLGDSRVTALECPRCGGLWLGHEGFTLISEKARERVDEDQVTRASPVALRAGESPPQSGPLYRRCPECDKLMHRRNFGQRSGVIIDVCKDDGFWFDVQELDALLKWIRRGGEAAAQRHEAAEQRHRARTEKLRFDREAAPETSLRPGAEPQWRDGFEFIERLLRSLFDL